jgi:hypothetical protein
LGHAFCCRAKACPSHCQERGGSGGGAHPPGRSSPGWWAAAGRRRSWSQSW